MDFREFFYLDPFGKISRALFAVFAAVDLLFFIGKDENVGKTLLDRGDAAGILALDDVPDLSGEHQFLFVHDLAVLDDIDGDVVVEKGEDVQIQRIDITFYLENVFFAHLVAAGIFDDSHGAVELVELQVMIDGKALAGSDVIQHEALFNFTNI